MKKSGVVWTGVLLATISIQAAAVRADSAQQAFADGKAFLAKADFRGALQAFAEAARTDRTNPQYLQHYSLVRQVIVLREGLDTERDPARWEYSARGLHAFYVSRGIYSEALSLDQRIHARLNTAASAAMLAETQLAMNMNAEAAEVLTALDPSKATSATRALLGLALARQGKGEGARRLAETIRLPENAGPGMIYTVARFHAEIGNTDHALSLLTRCFESVAPSRLDGFKSHAKQSPAFARLVSTPAFAKVLETKSKVPESKCSGGSSCAGCPMRGKCAKSQDR